MYVVVEFVNDSGDCPVVDIIPTNWLKTDSACWWPRTGASSKVKSRMGPDQDDWEIHEVSVVPNSGASAYLFIISMCSRLKNNIIISISSGLENGYAHFYFWVCFFLKWVHKKLSNRPPI